MFPDNTIQKRVMAVVKARIAEAQTRYNNGVEALENEHEDTVRRLEEEKEQKKTALADNLVNEIVGKII